MSDADSALDDVDLRDLEKLSEDTDIGKQMQGVVTRALREIHRLKNCADRAVTIADEAFGLGPVEPLDDTLDRIEQGINQQHRRILDLEMRETRLAADLGNAQTECALQRAKVEELRRRLPPNGSDSPGFEYRDKTR